MSESPEDKIRRLETRISELHSRNAGLRHEVNELRAASSAGEFIPEVHVPMTYRGITSFGWHEFDCGQASYQYARWAIGSAFEYCKAQNLGVQAGKVRIEVVEQDGIVLSTKMFIKAAK